MKAIVPIFIIILVVLGIYFFNSKSKIETSTLNIPDISGEEVAGDFEGIFVFDPAQSSVKWTGGKKIVVNYFDSGTINLKSGNVVFSNGLISGGEIVFDMSSISVTSTGKGDGQDGLTNHLKSADFFEVDTYNEARYVVTGVKNNNDNYVLEGELTLKGKTNPLNIPVKVATEAGNVILAGIAEVDRTLWDVRFGSDKFFDNLGDNVINDTFNLEFTITARP